MKYLVIIISILISAACQEAETKPNTIDEEEEVVEEMFFCLGNR
jgi:hypothetical protein